MTIKKIVRADCKANLTLERNDTRIIIKLELDGLPEMLMARIAELGNGLVPALLGAILNRMGGGLLSPDEAKAMAHQPNEDMSVH